jgi:hypothetical protein
MMTNISFEQGFEQGGYVHQPHQQQQQQNLAQQCFAVLQQVPVGVH